MSDELQTINPDQVAVATAIGADAFVFVQKPGGPLQKVSHSSLLSKLIKTDLVMPTEALLQADLAYDEDIVSIVVDDPDPLLNGWYRKAGASGTGGWVQFEQLAKVVREDAAESAQTAKALLQAAEGTLGTIYLTVEAGLTATVGGDYFLVGVGDGTVTRYLNNGGVATEQFGLATTDALASTSPGKGGSLVRYKSSLLSSESAAIITLTELGSRRADVRDGTGYDLNGNHDNASVLQTLLTQAASAGVEITHPAGKSVLGTTVAVPDGTVLVGLSGAYQAGTKTALTTLHFAHAGTGLLIDNPNGSQTIRGVGFLRDQPVPAAGWAPNDHGFDILVSGDTDFYGDDLLFINSSRGISFANGGGRHQLRNIRGQPFIVGINLEYSADVTRLWGSHFWDFWSSDANVLAWMLNNGTAYYSKRNDNADFYSLFSIFYRHGLRIGNWLGGGAGTTQRLRVFGAGFDACGSGLTIDSDVNGATLELHGFYAHGHDSIMTSGHLIDLQGTNSTTKVYGKTDLSNAHRSGINVVGAGAALSVQDPIINGYNLANGGYAAVNAGAGIYGITLRGDISISGGVSSAAQFSGTGRINGKIKRSYTPSITASGTAHGVTVAINSAVFDVLDNEVEAVVDFTIPANPGTGSLVLSLPINSAAGLFDVAFGEDAAPFGNALRVHVPANSSTCTIVTYNNQYPASSTASTRIVVRLKYRV